MQPQQLITMKKITNPQAPSSSSSTRASSSHSQGDDNLHDSDSPRSSSSASSLVVENGHSTTNNSSSSSSSNVSATNQSPAKSPAKDYRHIIRVWASKEHIPSLSETENKLNGQCICRNLAFCASLDGLHDVCLKILKRSDFSRHAEYVLNKCDFDNGGSSPLAFAIDNGNEQLAMAIIAHPSFSLAPVNYGEDDDREDDYSECQSCQLNKSGNSSKSGSPVGSFSGTVTNNYATSRDLLAKAVTTNHDAVSATGSSLDRNRTGVPVPKWQIKKRFQPGDNQAEQQSTVGNGPVTNRIENVNSSSSSKSSSPKNLWKVKSQSKDEYSNSYGNKHNKKGYWESGGYNTNAGNYDSWDDTGDYDYHYETAQSSKQSSPKSVSSKNAGHNNSKKKQKRWVKKSDLIKDKDSHSTINAVTSTATGTANSGKNFASSPATSPSSVRTSPMWRPVVKKDQKTIGNAAKTPSKANSKADSTPADSNISGDDQDQQYYDDYYYDDDYAAGANYDDMNIDELREEIYKLDTDYAAHDNGNSANENIVDDDIEYPETFTGIWHSTLLQDAIARKMSKVALALIKHPDFRVEYLNVEDDSSFATALILACEHKLEDVAMCILEFDDAENTTAEEKKKEIQKKNTSKTISKSAGGTTSTAAKQVNISQANETGQSALYWAARNEMFKVCLKILEKTQSLDVLIMDNEFESTTDYLNNHVNKKSKDERKINVLALVKKNMEAYNVNNRSEKKDSSICLQNNSNSITGNNSNNPWHTVYEKMNALYYHQRT